MRSAGVERIEIMREPLESRGMPVAFCVSRLVRVCRVGVYIAALSPASVMQYIADLEGEKRESVLDRSSVTFLMNLYARK